MTKKIESHLSEDRLFAPPKEFSKSARIKSLSQYKKIYRESIKSPSKFWSSEAKELKWQKKWDKVGKSGVKCLNVCYICQQVVYINTLIWLFSQANMSVN